MKTLEVRTLKEWRNWLGKHHATEREVWIIFHKRHTGRLSIAYADALDEALCFGWIDSLVKRLDDERYARKFTPRKPGSRWSAVNRKHYERLKTAGRLMPAGLNLPPTERSYAAPRSLPAQLPPYIRKAFRGEPQAWKNYQNLTPSQQRRYLGWIEYAKKDETKMKRLREAISLLSAGRKLGLK